MAEIETCHEMIWPADSFHKVVSIYKTILVSLILAYCEQLLLNLWPTRLDKILIKSAHWCLSVKSQIPHYEHDWIKSLPHPFWEYVCCTEVLSVYR